MGYHLPTDTDFVSCSWQCHKNRNPPSSEAGTDYGVGYGHVCLAPGNGTVVDLKHSNSDGTGRYCTIDMDDGRRTRSLHMAEVWVSVGQRVSKGQQVGLTGASGFGSDWGYGAHVHQTLFPGHAYTFGNGTIDFALYVDGMEPAGNQRVVGPNGANGRGDPSTANPSTQTLPPGTLANFNGWIRGETVEGNNVWFRGEFSGDWFWSGGFTDTGTHDLTDLNPTTPPAGNQRTVGPNGANGRADPSTNGGVTKVLAPSAVETMNGWITGQNVEGNTVWFRAADGTFYWSGGFTDAGTHDLADLNAPGPDPTTTQRTVGVNPANIRDLPYTTSPVIGSSDGGTVVDMQGFTHGSAVEGNDVWFQRKADGDWQWSGGFTSQSIEGLTEKAPPVPPEPASPDNPRGLPEYEPIWRFAFLGLEAPLGFTDCKNPVTRTPRDKAGSEQLPVDPVIDTYIIHWTDTGTNDEAATDWHSYCNSRSSCPTTQMNRDGRQTEFIRPGAKPAASGPDWNWRSFAVETVGGPDDFTPEQWEAHAQNIAELARLNGQLLDGVPVDFPEISRSNVMGHRELDGQEGTECPGDAQIAYLDTLIARAQEIYDGEEPGPTPGDGPLDPEGYPVMFDLYGELGQAFGNDGGGGRRRG